MIDFKAIRKLNFPIGEYSVFGSASMDLAGIRDAKDVDIIVTETLWKVISKKYPVTKNESTGKFNIQIGNIEIGKDLSPYTGSLVDVIANSEVVEGVAFASLEDVREIKKAFGRQKDLEDVKLIDEYLGEEIG
jgi:hypothetical protein